MVDFGLSTNPEALLLFSKHKLGKLVKEKAMNYAFKTLLDTKLKHSKMRFLEYSEFKRQNYFNLPGIHISEVRSTFLFRVHMHQFFENFRTGLKDSRLCPLCNKHSDSQENLATCEFIKSKLKGGLQYCDIENIYTENVFLKSLKRVTEAILVRFSENK